MFIYCLLFDRFEKTVKDAVVDVARELDSDYTREISSVDFFYRYVSFDLLFILHFVGFIEIVNFKFGVLKS